MEIPGNTWQEVWEVARPSPAKWQKRLFNDTREAEKILDYLERKTPSEFVKLLLPVFSVCVLQKLLDEMTDELPGLNDVVTKLIKKAEWFSRMSTIDEESYKVSYLSCLCVRHHMNCIFIYIFINFIHPFTQRDLYKKCSCSAFQVQY